MIYICTLHGLIFLLFQYLPACEPLFIIIISFNGLPRLGGIALFKERLRDERRKNPPRRGAKSIAGVNFYKEEN